MDASASRRIERNKKFVRRVRRFTVCANCGQQPVDWHREEHDSHPNWRVGNLGRGTASIDRIKREIRACTPLCRRCHMELDGRLARFMEIAKASPPPRPMVYCSECGEAARPSRRGLCGRCYDRRRPKRARGRKAKRYTQLECLRCGHVWEVEGHEEYGCWFPEHDDDLHCPECGTDGGEG